MKQWSPLGTIYKLFETVTNGLEMKKHYKFTTTV